MLEPIKYETNIEIKDIPLQWIPRFELYYPDLPQFPITYIHFNYKGEKIYGFVSAVSFDINGKNCNIKVLFLSNKRIDNKLKPIVKKEIEERFGSADKVGLKDIKACCNGNKDYENFFSELWKYISKTYGEYIPYGKFYEEIYSMVRFVSAWQPKTGRQSEMRMLYNFLSIFGQPIKVEGKWDYLEFFLIPTYEEVKNKKFSEFSNFGSLYESMEKIWKHYFTKTEELEDMNIHFMEKSWPISKEKFMTNITYPLLKKKIITLEDKHNIDRLVDAFNRHGWRAAFFIWSVMSIQDKDYNKWDKDFFIKFYSTKTGVGISPKVIACFLQQGFKNEEVIPIDIWVESFYQLALGINTKEEFFKSFSKMGKLERAIWLSSQANKTNIKTFFDLMWCTRFGVRGNKYLRGPNPISCYECKLRKKCPSYKKIKSLLVLISDYREDIDKLIQEANHKNCEFICLIRDSVPERILKKKGKNWILIDEFSGYLLTNHKLKSKKRVLPVDKLINSLPNFF